MSEEEDQEETTELLSINRSRFCNNMEARHDHQLAKRFKLFYTISVIIGVLFIILMFSWVFHYLGGITASKFNWHPLLMSTGMIFLYAQSMLFYRVVRYAKKRTLKLCHSVIHFLVFIFSVLGLQTVFAFHNEKNIPNMYSLHSWIGLITVILFSIQYVAGFVSFLYPGVPMDLRRIYLHVHTSFGTAIFVLATFSAILGTYEKLFFGFKEMSEYSELGPQATLVNCIGVVLIFFATLVLYLINEPTYKRTPLPEDDMLLSPTQPETAE